MNLSTSYLGMPLEHPVVASASPLSETLDGIRRLEDAGAAAVVMYSLFEEQIEEESHVLDHFLSYGSDSFGEALSYFPDQDSYNVGPEEYLKLVQAAHEATDIPIIGSLNGTSTGGWTEYARKIEQAGARALELNVYFIPTNPETTGRDIEQRYIDLVRSVKKNTSIPIAVKVSPYFSATAHMARELADAGANALVLFNRFFQPDFDLEALSVVPHLVLSSSDELRLPLRWVAILYGRVGADLAITGGVHTGIDVLKGMMAGAKITMMASELLANGLGRIDGILQEIRDWMEEHEYESIEQMQGSMSQMRVANPDAFERANYMKVLHSWREDPTGRLIR